MHRKITRETNGNDNKRTNIYNIKAIKPPYRKYFYNENIQNVHNFYSFNSFCCVYENCFLLSYFILGKQCNVDDDIIFNFQFLQLTVEIKRKIWPHIVPFNPFFFFRFLSCSQSLFVRFQHKDEKTASVDLDL